MNLHHLAEERSIALHRAIGARLRERPGLVEVARNRVADRVTRGLLHPDYAAAWQRVLAYELSKLVSFLESPSEEARELRQTTPFAGIISPQERWAIWKNVKERLMGNP